jgi:hypothetical protein
VVTVSDKKEVVLLRFVYPNVVAEMNKRDLDYRNLADILDIGEHAAYRRLRGLTGWKLHETIHLAQYFGIDDMAWLFSRCDTHCDTYTTKFPENQDGGDCYLQNL